MNDKSVLISVILLILLSFSLSETIKNKEQKEEKRNATSSTKMKINPMTTFTSSMIMNSYLEIDSPSAPDPSGGNWNIGDSLAFENQRINYKENKKEAEQEAPAPISTKSTDEKKEVKTKTKGLTLKEDIIYSVLSTSVKSSLKYSNYIKEKRYKEYAKKIGVDVIANLAARLAFKVIKGSMGNAIQFGLFLRTTLTNCKGKTVNDSIIHCLYQFIKLFLHIVAGIISDKMSKNIAIKAILYGILAYLAETGVSIIFTILLKK